MKPLFYALAMILTTNSLVSAQDAGKGEINPYVLWDTLTFDNGYPWWLEGPKGAGPLPPAENIEGYIFRYVFGCRTELANPDMVWCLVNHGFGNEQQLTQVESHNIKVQLVADNPKQVAKLAGLTMKPAKRVACSALKKGFDGPTVSYTTDSVCVIGRYVYKIHFSMKLIEETVNI